MAVNRRRLHTLKIERAKDIEIHVSVLTALPDQPGETHYLEVREYNTEAEIYGHGINVPIEKATELSDAVREVYEAWTTPQ